MKMITEHAMIDIAKMTYTYRAMKDLHWEIKKFIESAPL